MPSDSKAIKDLKANLNVTKGFLDLIEKLDSLPDMKKARYTDTRSLYQAVSKGRELEVMEKELEEFFGPPAKPAGKSISLLLRRNPSIKYLDGIREEQVLFIKKSKMGFYYGALWPWRRDPKQVTVHLGFLSPKMSDKDFKKHEDQVKSKVMHEKVFEKLEAGSGGQVHGISLATFLQMAAMEKITCTLKIQKDKSLGYLHLTDGDLIAAETGSMKDKQAAYKIISWENTVIDIEEASGKTENRINQPIMNILLEAATIKEEEGLRKKEAPIDLKVETEVADADTEVVVDLEDEVSQAIDAFLEEPVAEVEKVPKKRLPKIRLPKIRLTKKNVAVAVAAVIILGAGTFLAMRFIQSKRVEDAYKSALANVERQSGLRAKVAILQSFINAHPEDELAQNAAEKIKEIRNLFAKQDFKLTMSKAEELIKNNNHEELIAVYQAYLRKHPRSIHSATIRQKNKEISLLTANKDYDELVTSAPSGTIEKTSSYFKYLKKHPDGKHSDEIKKLIAGMSAEYYSLLSQEITSCSNQEDWEQCVQLSGTFVTIYPDHEMANEIKEFKTFAGERLKDQKILAELKQNAERAGQDYKAAKQVYFAYLNAHPGSSLKDKIRAEIAILKEHERLARMQNAREKIAALLKESGGRFVDNHNGTIKDTKTGLVWCMLDSLMEKQKCLSYEDAKTYVKALKTGGHQDWRLPTESELVEIYKKKPFFPLRETEWYWTSKSFSRYSDGWQEMVHIVTTKQETKWENEQANAKDCGAVHAVRP